MANCPEIARSPRREEGGSPNLDAQKPHLLTSVATFGSKFEDDDEDEDDYEIAADLREQL